ncbi:MAG: N-acetyltransferase family protein [Vicinamibacterales bacterium]
MSARRLDAEDAPLVKRLIAAYAFKPYRNYRLLPRRRQTAVLEAEVEALLAAPGHIATVSGAGEDTAVAIGRALAWDTAFFGVPMARLDYVLRSGDGARSVYESAVDAFLARCLATGLRHLSARLDVADSLGVAVLEERGFRLMDTLVTYVSHPKRQAPRHVKGVGTIRPFVPEDLEHILEITRDAYRGFRGRFQLDPHLPRDRSDALYVEWARRCCDGGMADRVYVADDGHGGLHGWSSVRLVEPVSTIGEVSVFAGSLGAVRPDRPGGYAALIGAAARDNHAAGALTEAQTQNHNFAMIRVLEAVGAQYARAEYTFHAWLG